MAHMCSTDWNSRGLMRVCLFKKKNLIPIHVMFQVRIQKVVEPPSSPPAEDLESDAAAEPAEQDELLDCVTSVEQNDWLWTS